MRRRTAAAFLATLPLVTALLVGCGDDDPSADEATTTAKPATTAAPETTAAPDPTGTPGGGTGASTLTFETADGSISVEFDGADCTSMDESTFAAEGTDGGTTIETTVSGMKGSVRLSGATEFEGTVDDARVSDTGQLTASGKGSPPDPGATTVDFTLTGQCSG